MREQGYTTAMLKWKRSQVLMEELELDKDYYIPKPVRVLYEELGRRGYVWAGHDWVRMIYAAINKAEPPA